MLATAVGVGASDNRNNGGGYSAAIIAQLVNNMAQLKFSRTDESEADTYGLKYMAQAGYDPREMLGVMQILKEVAGTGRSPEMLQTHPLPQTRLDAISAKLKEAYPSGVPDTLSTKNYCENHYPAEAAHHARQQSRRQFSRSRVRPAASRSAEPRNRSRIVIRICSSRTRLLDNPTAILANSSTDPATRSLIALCRVLDPIRETDVSPASITTGAPIQSVWQVVVPPLYGNVSNTVSNSVRLSRSTSKTPSTRETLFETHRPLRVQTRRAAPVRQSASSQSPGRLNHHLRLRNRSQHPAPSGGNHRRIGLRQRVEQPNFTGQSLCRFPTSGPAGGSSKVTRRQSRSRSE